MSPKWMRYVLCGLLLLLLGGGGGAIESAAGSEAEDRVNARTLMSRQVGPAGRARVGTFARMTRALPVHPEKKVVRAMRSDVMKAPRQRMLESVRCSLQR